MKTALLVFIVLLHGCGGGQESEPPPDNHGYGFTYDAQSKGGLKLRQIGATTADADFLEAIAHTVELCANIDTAPPPFVVVVAKDSMAPNVGLYFSNPPLIVLDESWLHAAYPHEVAHYLLDMSAGDLDQDHSSALFRTCVI